MKHQAFAQKTFSISSRRKKILGMRIYMFSAAFGLVFCPLSSTLATQAQDAVPQKNYAQEYLLPFKGKPDDMHNFIFKGGEDAEKQVTFEPDGLRITLPLGYPGTRPGTGLYVVTSVKGDFEISVNFEILKEPEPTGSWGTRVSLGAVVNDPKWHEGSVSQKIDGKGRKQYFTYLATPAAGANKAQTMSNTFANTAKSGRLRLVRAGSVLSFYASPNGANDFTFLKEYPFVTTDLKAVYISAATHDPKEALDVRLTELRVRADSLENAAAAPVATNPPPRRTALWLVVGSAVTLTLIIGAVLIMRRRKHTAGHRPAKAQE